MRNRKLTFLNFLIASFLILALMFFAACNKKHQDPKGSAPAVQKADPHEGHDHAAHKAEGQAAEVKDAHEGCANHKKKAEGQAAEKHDDHEAEKADEHAGHGHGAAGDLDKGIEELFAANCEHGVKTHQCEECRYEVGVVKVPQDLIDSGLVSVSDVSRRNFDSEIGMTGEIQFDKQKIAHLGPRVAGVVLSVKVDIGDQVKTGQTLVVLESVELAEAQAAYLEALAGKHLAQKTHDRQKALYEKKISSEKDFLEAQQQFESASIQANSARQKLLRMGLSKSAVSNLAKTGHAAATGRLPVAAPFAGRVLELHAVRGELIEPGAEMVLFGDTSSLWVWIDLYEAQLAAVNSALTEKGLPVTVSVRAWPNERFMGYVDYVGNVMDEQTHTIKSRVVLDNAHGKLKPGMFANVALGIDSAQGRIAAPSSAVVSDEGREFVFVRQQGDYFVRRPVTKGRQVDGFVELLDGIDEGQTIVVAGTFLLKSDVLRSKMGAGCAH